MKCNHIKDTKHGSIDCRNPYNGKCAKCGEYVILWERALLLFVPLRFAYDFTSRNFACIVFFKCLFRKTYVLKSKFYERLKTTNNDEQDFEWRSV